ncbi:MAG: dTMP kinase [SAR324 cluster bacterium]|nr:dTMP kinase [SAR324 cluster bacterium]
MKNSGLFVAIEGVDGSGKTLQVKRVATLLKQHNHSIITTREPGGSSFGGQIREILCDPNQKLDVVSEVFLLLADRHEHYMKIISKKLKGGNIVISDRYLDSTFVYQGYAVNRDPQWIRDLLDKTQIKTPDLTIWLYLPIDDALARVEKRNSEQSLIKPCYEQVDFLTKVVKGYETLYAQNNNNSVKKIDARLPTEEVTDSIFRAIIDAWAKKNN